MDILDGAPFPNDPNGVLQQLRFWVDVNGNGYGDDTCLLTTAVVDDTWPLTRRVPPCGVARDAIAELRWDRRVKGWSAGYVGLYRGSGGSSVQQYDDVKIGDLG